METSEQKYSDVVETLRSLYRKGKITKDQVTLMRAGKKITQEEYEYIISED